MTLCQKANEVGLLYCILIRVANGTFVERSYSLTYIDVLFKVDRCGKAGLEKAEISKALGGRQPVSHFVENCRSEEKNSLRVSLNCMIAKTKTPLCLFLCDSNFQDFESGDVIRVSGG